MIERWVIGALVRWVEWIAPRAVWVLTIIAVTTGVCGWYAVDRYRMNSQLSDLIRQEAPWRDDFDRYEAQFPDLVRTAVVVVSGDEFKQVEDTALVLEARIRAHERFEAVQAPQNEPFLREHAFLYQEVSELEDMADRLAEAQPMLTVVAEDPSLRGVLKLIVDGIENDPPSGFDTVVARLTESGSAVLEGRDPTVLWTNEFFTSDERVYRLITLKGRSEPGATLPDAGLPNAEVMSALRGVIAEVPIPEGVRVEITGEIALAFEEIEAAMSGVQVAGWLSLVLLSLVLLVGVRSAKIIAATLLLLAVGAVWTAAWAMLAVGEFNTLSVVFIVMFFGLGVDFAIHYSLRYQEAVNRGVVSPRTALATTTKSVGGAIVICTTTTMLGFIGFVPTPYKGLADLGIISAGGMLVAAFLAFTLLPAFYMVCGRIRTHTTDLPSSERFVAKLIEQRVTTVGVIAVLSLGAGFFALQAKFDYSVLALKNEKAESMVALRRLQAENLATDYAMHVLSDTPLDPAALEALPVVDGVITLDDYVPKDQSVKLDILEDLRSLLGSAVAPVRGLDAPGSAEIREGMQRVLAAARTQDSDGRFVELADVLERLLERPDQSLVIWQRGVVSNLEEELAWLRRAIAVHEIGIEDLPRSLRERHISSEGQHLAIVLPAENVAPVEALSAFIEGVLALEPHATGRPSLEWGVGEIVVTSFQQALLFAFVSILLVLIVMFQSVRWAMLIVVPLALTALFTLAVGVWLDAPLNMANILVLPLIFGLGVDNGVHVVDRYRTAGDVGRFMHSSTPRAVLLSTLTTIGTFSALSLSPHQGTASIGQLLAVAVAMLLVFTIFLLPVLLTMLAPRGYLAEHTA